MSSLAQAVDVKAPVARVYERWTRFEDFPRFMAGVRAVHQRDGRHLDWEVAIGGREKTWEARIDEQIPQKRIAWHSVRGARNAGCVTFHRLSDDTSRIMVQMAYEPEGVLERVGDLLGMARLRVRDDLDRFKRFVENESAGDGAVELASEGSFPASDAPPWSPGTV